MGQKSRAKQERRTQMGRRIVKVQLSLATNAPFDSALPSLMRRRMLLYDKTKQWQYEGNVSAEIVALMGDKDKMYFWATKEGPYVRVDTTLQCNQEQGW